MARFPIYLFLLTLMILVPPVVSQDAPRPNIIFLLTDDQRWDTLGCMGNSIIQTPNLDRLSEQGITYDNAFVTTAICMTSRASILSGQYAARHGIWNFNRAFTKEQLAQTYPGRLKQAGYRTGFIGKWGVGNPPNDVFDYNRGFPGQGRFILEVDGETRHLTSVMGDQALEFLDQTNGDSPFCLSVSFKAPHVQDTSNVYEQAFPYDPKLNDLYANDYIPVPAAAAHEYFDRLPDFLKDSENRGRWAVRFWGPKRYQFSVKSYYRLISGVDVVVGRIREKLNALGLDENTVIVFSSDHGFYLGEYGFAGKWYPHEVSIRIPMIVMDPRLPESLRGTRRAEPVLNIDLAPTILDLARVPIPDGMQGRSLYPLFVGDPPADWRTDFFYEHLFDHARIPKSEGVRDSNWKYIRYVESNPLFEELYDLTNDPLEVNNLANKESHQVRLEAMRSRWTELKAQVYAN